MQDEYDVSELLEEIEQQRQTIDYMTEILLGLGFELDELLVASTPS